MQDGYPFIFQGRDNGAMYWGQFDKVKVSAGAFDGSSATGDDTLLGAGRVQVDFWDPEPGYYLNGTYYGDKNLLAIGGAGQVQGGDKSAYNVDFLLERKVGDGGAVHGRSRVGEVRPPRRLQRALRHRRRRLRARRVPVPAARRDRPLRGARQVRARALPRGRRPPLDLDYDQKTTELNLNYVIKQFNARVDVVLQGHALRRGADRTSSQIGIGLQFQM